MVCPLHHNGIKLKSSHLESVEDKQHDSCKGKELKEYRKRSRNAQEDSLQGGDRPNWKQNIFSIALFMQILTLHALLTDWFFYGVFLLWALRALYATCLIHPVMEALLSMLSLLVISLSRHSRTETRIRRTTSFSLPLAMEEKKSALYPFHACMLA